MTTTPAKRLPDFRSLLAEPHRTTFNRHWGSPGPAGLRYRRSIEEARNALNWAQIELDSIEYGRMPSKSRGPNETEIFVLAALEGAPFTWIFRGHAMIRGTVKDLQPLRVFVPHTSGDRPAWGLADGSDFFYEIPAAPDGLSEDGAHAFDRKHRKRAVTHLEHELAGVLRRRFDLEQGAYRRRHSPEQQLLRAEGKVVDAEERLEQARQSVKDAERDLGVALDELARLRQDLGNVVSIHSRKEG